MKIIAIDNVKCVEDCLTIIDKNGYQCGDLRISGYNKTWSLRKRDLK